jgi:PAS domain S-box-containing protein
MAGTLQLSRVLMEREKAQWQHRTDAETVHIAEQLHTGLLERVSPLRGVGAWWQLQGRPLDSEDWQTDLRLFFESGNGLERVTWIDAAGKRSWSIGRGTVPNARRFDPVAPELKELTTVVGRKNPLALSHIFEQPDGRRAIYACVPILNRGAVSAYVVGLYDLTELLKAVLEHQIPHDYSVLIIADGRQIDLFHNNAQRERGIAQTASVRLSNATWLVRVHADPDDLQSLGKLVLSFGVAVTLLLSLTTLIGGITYRRTIELRDEIRERKAAEEQVAILNRDLQRRLADFQALFEVTPIGIAVSYDPECRRIWINPALAKMMGVAQGQNISKSGPEADSMRFQVLRDGRELSPDELPMQVAGRTGREILAEQLDIVREDGRLVNTLAYTAPLFDENGRVRGALHASVDITHRKRAEQEHNLLEQKLLRAEKFKSLALMAGSLAHDLNNLLASVIGNDSLALELVPRNGDARGLLLASLEASHKAAGLMQQLVRYTGRTFYTPMPLDISRVIDDLAKELRAAVPPGIALHLELSDHLPLIGAGLIEIQHVLHNLVTNAVDAIGEGPGQISVTTKSYDLSEDMNVALYNDQDILSGTYVEVVVADTGCGMTPDIAAKAFDPFFTTKFLGRGLGLAEVQGVLRAHRGAVRVESSPSIGSKFILLFPALTSVSAATAQSRR